ncbi:unnamed protein product [Lampetra fluviatilis]
MTKTTETSFSPQPLMLQISWRAQRTCCRRRKRERARESIRPQQRYRRPSRPASLSRAAGLKRLQSRTRWLFKGPDS